jgi:hypothetical protein
LPLNLQFIGGHYLPADYVLRIETANTEDIRVIHSFTSFFNSAAKYINLNAYAEIILDGVLLFFDKLSDFQMFHDLYTRIGKEMEEKIESTPPQIDDQEVVLDITFEMMPKNETLEQDLFPLMKAGYALLPEGVILEPQNDNHARIHFSTLQLLTKFFDTFDDILAENL